MTYWPRTRVRGTKCGRQAHNKTTAALPCVSCMCAPGRGPQLLIRTTRPSIRYDNTHAVIETTDKQLYGWHLAWSTTNDGAPEINELLLFLLLSLEID